MIRVSRSVLLVLPLLFAAASALGAQRVDPTRVFDLSVDMDGEMMSASVPEGSGFSLTLRQTTEFELVPVLAPGTGDRVTIAVYRSASGDPATRRLAERVEVAIGTPAPIRSIPGWRLVVDRMRHVETSAQLVRPVSRAPGAPFRLALQDDRCCVCCGNVCACACGVRMGCGSCCMGSCCAAMPAEPASAPGGGGDQEPRATRMALLLGTRGCDESFPALAARIASTR